MEELLYTLMKDRNIKGRNNRGVKMEAIQADNTEQYYQ